MNLHPFMVEAIYLRMHPQDKIVKDTGIEIWYCEIDNKYKWQYQKTSPKYKNRSKVYEAKGLQGWWETYLKQLEAEQNSTDEEKLF